MQKKETRLIGVAFIIGGMAVGAHLYMQDEETLNPPDATVEVAPRPAEVVTKTAPDSETPAVTETVAAKSETTPMPNLQAPEHIDPLVVHQENLIKGIKNKIKLNITLPGDMKFDELDLDNGVAAMHGSSPDKKMLIMAAARQASPQIIAAFLQDQKARIPLLNNQDFKISGELKVVSGPKNSGISKITIIPGGEMNGSMVFAAYLERNDKKGSYVFVMKGSSSYFKNHEGDMEYMMSSLLAK